MSLGLRIVLCTIFEAIVLWVVLPYFRDPLPILVIAAVGWPGLVITVVMLDVHWRAAAGRADMLALYNYSNTAAIRQDVDQINQRQIHSMRNTSL